MAGWPRTRTRQPGLARYERMRGRRGWRRQGTTLRPGDYTQGYTYGGEGGVDLEVIRNYADVAWGRVTGPGGRPVAHREVVETAHGRPVNASRTDSAGWYVMPRSGRCPATLVVETAGDARTFTCSGNEARRVDLHV